MKRFHGDKRFQCNICQRSFAATEGLEKHMPIHNVTNPFSCEICHKGFAHYSSLRRHLVAHNGVKNYQCAQCDKYFMRKDSLNNHRILSCTGRPETPPLNLDDTFRQDDLISEIKNLVPVDALNNPELPGLSHELIEAIKQVVK